MARHASRAKVPHIFREEHGAVLVVNTKRRPRLVVVVVASVTGHASKTRNEANQAQTFTGA